MDRIFVTGIGIISPLGETVEANRQQLQNGTQAVSHLDFFTSRYANTLHFGEIKLATEQLKENLKVKESGVTRTTLLALHAFAAAISDSKLSTKDLKATNTALVGANTVGGMCLTDELHKDANSTTRGSAFISSYDPGAVNIFLQKKYGLNGIIDTINTACSSSANAIMYGARLIKNGFAKRAIVGGTDSLAKFTINGFNALHILSPEVCQPFDAHRKGLNLGEGAAFLVLEHESEIRSKKIYAELTGWANANDAFHPSSLSETGKGPTLAMENALNLASLLPESIGFINTHGTGTENNDEVESKAMVKIFGKVPPFASTKSNIGHTLGAASAIEAVYSVLNIYHQEIYPSMGFKEAIHSTKLEPVLQYNQTTLENVMSNSFGFGGNCSSLIFSKI